MLCGAIQQGVHVELRYRKPDEMPDMMFRKFGPIAVYHSEQNKVCVSGDHIADRTPRNFEVGRIIDMRITTDPFQPSAAVDYTQAKYRNGVICRR